MPKPGIDDVSRYLVGLCRSEGWTLLLRDSNDTQHRVLPDTVANPDGYLPVFVVAAEAVWAEASGGGFGLRIVEDPAALVGYRVEDFGDIPFAIVAHCMLHAIECARNNQELYVDRLVKIAAATRARAISSMAEASRRNVLELRQPGQRLGVAEEGHRA